MPVAMGVGIVVKGNNWVRDVVAQAAAVHLLLEALEQLNEGLSSHSAAPWIVGRALPPHIGGENRVHQLIVVVVVAHPGVAVLQVFDGLNIHQSLDFLLNVHTLTSMIFFPHRGGKQKLYLCCGSVCFFPNTISWVGLMTK